MVCPLSSQLLDGGRVSTEPKDVILWKDSETSQRPVFGPELDNQQRRDLLDLLEEFTDVLQDKPGRTTLAEHNIET